jgi:hypothetical protein
MEASTRHHPGDMSDDGRAERRMAVETIRRYHEAQLRLLLSTFARRSRNLTPENSTRSRSTS